MPILHTFGKLTDAYTKIMGTTKFLFIEKTKQHDKKFQPKDTNITWRMQLIIKL